MHALMLFIGMFVPWTAHRSLTHTHTYIHTHLFPLSLMSSLHVSSVGPLSSPLLSPSTPTQQCASWAGATGCGPAVWVKNTLPKSVASIASILSTNSEDWKSRVNALQEIERIILDCKEYERVSIGTSAAASFAVTLGALLSSLAPALSTQISDLRSEIVRQAAHTISALATQLGDTLAADHETVQTGPFHKCGAKLLPALVTQAASNNSVIRGYSEKACSDVVKHVLSVVGSGGSGVLGYLLSEVTQIHALHARYCTPIHAVSVLICACMFILCVCS
jgi:hypothetical protein